METQYSPLVLLPFTEEDFTRLISWVKTEEQLVQFAGVMFPFPLTKEALQRYIQDNRRIPLKVVRKDNGNVIGHGELNYEFDVPRLSRILIGEEENRNKGYGKYIVSAMLDKIFSSTHTEEVELNVFEFNSGAIRCYEKVGFRYKAPGKDFSCQGKVWKSINMVISKKQYLNKLATT